MIAVIFEVFPKSENKQEYLDIALELKPLLSETALHTRPFLDGVSYLKPLILHNYRH